MLRDAASTAISKRRAVGMPKAQGDAEAAAKRDRLAEILPA
jgi:hypothetical protein